MNIARNVNVTPEKDVWVLDSFALLAYLSAEPGFQRVQEILAQAQDGRCHVLLCTINLGEVLYLTERRRGLVAAQRVQALIESLPLEIVEASRDLVLEAAHIKANHALSYADAFVVAIAKPENGTILTGDPGFHTVEKLAPIEWLT
jgi:predicted nucleic acid-binding protein